jgi:hypothetical protein
MAYQPLLALVCACAAIPFVIGTMNDVQKGQITRNGTTRLGGVRSLRDFWEVARFNASMSGVLIGVATIYFFLSIP